MPKLSIYSNPPSDGTVKKLVLPVKSSVPVNPLSLIGISLLESSIVPTVMPLFAAYNSSTRRFAFSFEREILELFNSSSIFVFVLEVSDLVKLTPGALLTMSSNSSPSSFNTRGSSPYIAKLTSAKTGGPDMYESVIISMSGFC